MTDLDAKLDRMLGKVDALMALQADHSARLDDLNRRVALVEQGVTATKDVVEAWGAAKYSIRLVQRIAGFAAAIAGLVAAAKGWLHR
ncbi:MAG TPA: hypothetical protein VFF84_04805 [Sphingobium sp.]|nr:hypothetical protein [Sphingobium sp.]